MPTLGEKSGALRETNIGLCDLGENETGMKRMKLNISEVPQYSLIEGSIIVAEGFNSTMKFNVNRIHNPSVRPQLQMKQGQLMNYNVDLAKSKAL